MSLILCGQKAERPLCHSKLNIHIHSEQELAYLVSSYPLLCTGGFISDELTEWLRTGIRRDDLADEITAMRKRRESDESILKALVDGCNYLDPSERDAFTRRLSSIRNFADHERAREEGRVLFGLKHFSAAGDKFSEAVRLLEGNLRRQGRPDDAQLKKVYELKAGLLLDMAAVKLQLFDEKGALRLIHESLDTSWSTRGAEMLYLVDGSGEIDERDKARLDKLKEEAYKKAEESPACTEVMSIFESENSDKRQQAKRLAAAWKKSLRRM